MQARNFMFEDIQKSIDLAELEYPDGTKKGAPNILIALGLSCYTEYWGKLLLGLPREKSRTCYEEFLKCLGDSYKPGGVLASWSSYLSQFTFPYVTHTYHSNSLHPCD